MKMNLKFNPEAAEIARRVTLPFIKQKVGQPQYVYFLEPYHISKKMGTAEDKQETTLGHVINLQDGLESEMILSTVTKSTLDDAYPEAGYVGRAFKIELHAVEGKKYHKVALEEIKLDAEDKKALDAERAKIIDGIDPDQKPVEEQQKTDEVKPVEAVKKGK